MRICVDALFGAQYAQITRRFIPKNFGVGVFLGSFRRSSRRGDGGFDKYIPAFDLIEGLAQDGHPILKGHALWDDDHEYGKPGDIELIKREARKLEAIARVNPEIEFIFSPFCEYAPLPKPIDYYLDICAIEAPHCLMLASPSKSLGGIPSKKYRNEYHGAELGGPGPFQWSADGSSIFDIDLPTILRQLEAAGCISAALWFPQENRKGKTKDKTPRPQRMIIPVQEQFELMLYQLTPRGRQARLDPAWTYKVSADQSPKTASPVGEDCKPVLVGPANAKYAKAELLLANGKVIATMPWTEEQREEVNGAPVGKVIGQLYRMANNEWGHKLAARVAKLQKQKCLSVRVNGQIIGKINPGMRQNKWRFD
jgi:hypothetical protein